MKIKYELLNETAIEPAFDLATEVFFSGSTLHKALEIELGEYREYLRPSFAEMVTEGLSVLATDQESCSVVGCMIVSDLMLHLEPQIPNNNRFAPLVMLTTELNRQYAEWRQIKKGQTALVDIGAVSPLAAGKGVYQEMRRLAQTNAKERGYRWIVGELSSSATQHVVLNKLGHRLVAEVRYSEFEYDGKFPFRTILQPERIVLAEGEL